MKELQGSGSEKPLEVGANKQLETGVNQVQHSVQHPSGACQGGGSCYRCGGPHHPASCRFRNTECLCCKKIGHISRVCQSRGRQRGQNLKQGKGGPVSQTNQVVADPGDAVECDNDVVDEEAYVLFRVSDDWCVH